MSAVAERAQRSATPENTGKSRKHRNKFDNTRAAKTHNTTKYTYAVQAAQKKPDLFPVLACFKISCFVHFSSVSAESQTSVTTFSCPLKRICRRLCYLQRDSVFSSAVSICSNFVYSVALRVFAAHALTNWCRPFLYLLVFYPFACVFWSCSVLSSLGRRRGAFISSKKVVRPCYEGYSGYFVIFNPHEKPKMYCRHTQYDSEVFLRHKMKHIHLHIESRDKPESVATQQTCHFQLFLCHTSALPHKYSPHIKKWMHKCNYCSIIYQNQVPLC